MCGIAGGFAFKKEGENTLSKIDKAICTIHHRGPDGDGVFQGGHIALAHKRLSIIDTSEAANQPMYSTDENYCIVFNGEIFNYKELASKHLQGYSFNTTSDTEVFLNLFIKLGTDAFALLRGFFAAALYDKKNDTLFLVRDRFGKKPIHYYRDEEKILFASELKALMAFGISKKINKQALSYYFQLNYIPSPLSIIEQVQKLLPGSFLKINKNSVEQKSYFALNIEKENYPLYTYEVAKSRLVTLMDEATKLRLIADVPLGSFLSGGIDSSVVVALASRHQQKLKTFSIGYKDNAFFDETHYAHLVAKKYETDHTVFSLGTNDFLEHIDDVLNAIDEPFADSSTIPTFILSKYTRKHVTVALSGDGGDEVFAGYNKHKAELKASEPSMQKNIVKGLAPLWKVLPKSRNNKFTNKIRQLHRFAEGVNLSSEDRYWKWASILSSENVKDLLQYHHVADKKLKESYPYHFSGNDFNETLLADMKMVLVGDMLVKVDMMSMANSLEIRSPFLDQEVVSFAFGLPANYKIDGRMKKKIVQDAFRDLLPNELYNRPKQGFDIPLLQWFKKELWGKINDDLLSDTYIKDQNIFNLSFIQSLKKKLFSNNPEDSHETIWAIIVFQHWWKKNM